MRIISLGNDSLDGHWEMMCLPTRFEMDYFPQGFPESLLDKLRSEYSIAARKASIAAITPDRMQALALEYFEGLTSEQQGTAGRFDARSGKFSNSATNVNFRHTWLPQRIEASFDQAGFDAYLRDKGHDPEALRASAALLPPEEQAA